MYTFTLLVHQLTNFLQHEKRGCATDGTECCPAMQEDRGRRNAPTPGIEVKRILQQHQAATSDLSVHS